MSMEPEGEAGWAFVKVMVTPRPAGCRQPTGLGREITPPPRYPCLSAQAARDRTPPTQAPQAPRHRYLHLNTPPSNRAYLRHLPPSSPGRFWWA